jgi:hypothetical protein
VSKSLLVELAAVPEPEEQLRLWDEARAGGLGVRGLRAARKGGGPAPGQAPLEACLAEARRLLARLERLAPPEPGDATLEALMAAHAAIGRRLGALAGTARHRGRRG